MCARPPPQPLHADGYGDAGLPPTVPGGATLTVDVELVACVKVEDMTRDGGIVRRIMQAAKNAWKTPGSGTKVGGAPLEP
eukprot:35252-Chlamydomonas_euryale.AAC.2